MTVRQACRDRRPLDGTDAQALEGALTQAEKELATLRKQVKEMEDKVQKASKLCGKRDGKIYMLLWDAIDIATNALKGEVK